MRFALAAIVMLLGAMTMTEAKKATTTRYWDCSGGSCGCGYKKNGRNVHCESNAMFKAPRNNKYGAKFYGAAALSPSLGGDAWMSKGCGRCFKVTGKANIRGHSHTTTVVLKGTNSCPPSNPACNGKDHFDIAAPGFDFPSKSLHNVCDQVGMEKALRSPQTCSYWMIHSQDPNKLCNCDSIQDGTLREGCKNFKSLYWANPTVDYEIVECPRELKEHPPCWHDNGDRWPSTKPAKCSSGYREFFEDEDNAQTLIEEIDVETPIEETVVEAPEENVVDATSTTSEDAVLM